MDFEKKYLKYKTKYINLKNNIKGGMVEVLRPPIYEELKEETKLKDVIDVEYITLIKSCIKQFQNHVHKLLGFYDLESFESYHIKNIIIINKDLTESQIILNNINIEDKLIENELYDDLTKISQIKSNIISYLKENKNKLKYMDNIFLSGSSIIEIDKCEITVNFVKPTEKQTGGFNPEIKCFHSEMIGLIRIYAEPIIEFINNFISMSYHKLKSDGNKHTYPIKYNDIYNYISNEVSEDDLEKYYVMLIDTVYKKDRFGELDFVKKILNKIGFSQIMLRNKTYIKEILLEHLLNNKYAHNGIDNIDILKLANNIIKKSETDILDIDSLAFLHSYLHYLDELNMFNESELMKIDLNKDIKMELRGCFKKSVSIICFENILNHHQYDFLEKSSEGYKYPYLIKKDALEDKKRQYSTYDDLYENFYDQISDFGRPIDKKEYIDKPYGRYEYLKEYYNKTYVGLNEFIENNDELQKITEIDKSFKLSNIVKIFNKKYKKMSKDDIINLILIYLHDYIYILDESDV